VFGEADTRFDPSGLLHSPGIQFGSIYRKEQPSKSQSNYSAQKLIETKLEELTAQGIKRSLQALVQLSFSGFGIQVAFLRALLSFGRFGLQPGNFVVQLSNFRLQTRILGGKIVQLRLQESLVSGSLSPNP
jgi:hypothetical protein